MRRVRALALIAFVSLALAGCGGGADPVDPAAALSSAKMALRPAGDCAASAPDARMVQGNCISVFGEMAPAPMAYPQTSTGGKAPLRYVTALGVLDWAGTAFPQFFPGSYQAGSISVAPFGTFNYRYFPASGNFLAYLGDAIYVYGPLSAYQILLVGQVSDFSCVIESCSSGGGSSTGTGTGSGGSGSGSSGYYSWNGSVNGTVVKDNDNESYQVRTSDGTVVDSTNTILTGLTVDSSANVRAGGSIVGYVGLAPAASSSGKVAVFYCSNGSYLDVVVTSTWTTRCGSGSSSGGGTSTGGSSGGSSSGGSSGGSSRSFYTWTGNANGEVVLDATDESFRFYTDTGCIYSDNTRTEYTNFCLSGANVYFSGSTYSVSRIRATNGSCIAGLLTSDGYYADIYTSAGRIQYIQKSSKRPVSC